MKPGVDLAGRCGAGRCVLVGGCFLELAHPSTQRLVHSTAPLGAGFHRLRGGGDGIRILSASFFSHVNSPRIINKSRIHLGCPSLNIVAVTTVYGALHAALWSLTLPA